MIFILFLLLTSCAGAETPVVTSPSTASPIVNQTCYLHHFETSRFPWPLGDCLNYEEVFKNFQFYEAKWDQSNLVLTIKKFENGNVTKTQLFKYMDNKLIEQNVTIFKTPNSGTQK